MGKPKCKVVFCPFLNKHRKFKDEYRKNIKIKQNNRNPDTARPIAKPLSK